MKDRRFWPIFDSNEWEYVGTRYPWYKFIKRNEHKGGYVGVQYVSCAQYIEFSEDGVVDNCLICEPLLPSLRDYNNYLN